MGNPFGGQAKSSSKSKFKSITGKSGGGQKFEGDKQGSPAMAKSMKSGHDSGSSPVYGSKGKDRLDKYARGGRTKKGTNVNIAIVVPGGKSAEPMAAPGVPPPPPVGPGGGPPPGMIPTGMPPMGRKRGGSVMTAGAESGVGRLQKAKIAKGK